MKTGRESYSSEHIRSILTATKSIAMIGASSNPERASNSVMQFLQKAGYHVIPVNPYLTGQQLLEEKVYASIDEIPLRIDMVNVFRRTEAIPALVDELLPLVASKGIRYLWLQLGIYDATSAMRASEAGVDVVMDRCLMIEHRKLKLGNLIQGTSVRFGHAAARSSNAYRNKTS